MKNQKGITLIALVITIIVLLILAGVSIAMLTGDNGILTQSQKASAETKISQAKELAVTDVAAAYAEFLENKYTNDAAYTGTFGATVTSSDTSKYTVSSSTITIVPKKADGTEVTGTIGSNGKITWSDESGT